MIPLARLFRAATVINMLISPLKVILVIAILSPLLVLAQNEKLPAVLMPDAESRAEAERVGGKVFKLLPRKMFPDVPGSYKDEDNPIGIRGGGWFYSFSTGSHSYNRSPEISADETSLTDGGMSGISFFADLGARDLASINETLPEAEFFLSYKRPLLLKDAIQERKDLFQRKIGALTIMSRQIRFTLGNLYLYRSITWDRADIVVVLEVFKRHSDGSVTIVWKKLADFPMPFVFDMSDQEMQKKVDQVLADDNFVGYKILVKDNHLYFLGPRHDLDSEIENALRRRGIRFRGSGGALPD